MDLRPPPENATIEELQKWNRDLYRFLEFPTFELIRLIPRSTAPSGFTGLSYFDSIDNVVKIYNGTEYIDIYDQVDFRNKIINGDFPIWQRATSQTLSGVLSDDRWDNTHVGATKTHSQGVFTTGQTDVPNNPTYYSSTVISASGSGSTDFVIKQQKIEDVRTLSGKTATLSFYAKANSTKYLSIEFAQVFGTGGSPSSPVLSMGIETFTLTTSWQKFSATVDIDSILGKTIGTDNNHFLAVVFWFSAGSYYDSRSNSLGFQTGTFDIAQVQLEEGTIATAFEQRPFGIELILCQRYYEYNGVGSSSALLYDGYAVINSPRVTGQRYRVRKRTGPTVYLTHQNCSNYPTSAGTVTSDESGLRESRTATATATRGWFSTMWKADAEF